MPEKHILLCDEAFADVVTTTAFRYRTLAAVASLWVVAVPPGTVLPSPETSILVAPPHGAVVERTCLSLPHDDPNMIEAQCMFIAALGEILGPPVREEDAARRVLVYQTEAPDQGRWTATITAAIETGPIGRYCVPKQRPPATWLSLAPMRTVDCTPVEVDVHRVAVFLNDVGKQLVEAGELDVQVWAQHRTSKGQADGVQITGVIIDVDKRTDDILGELEAAGVHLIPTAAWNTNGGYKLLYASRNKRIVPKDEPGNTTDKNTEADIAIGFDSTEHLATWLTLALEGGDPGSWEVAHGQHLPICLKTKDSETLTVEHPAVQLNPAPLNLEDLPTTELPMRLRIAWGTGASVTTSERETIEEYLSDLGAPAPEEPGTHCRYDRCPDTDSHSNPSFYVYRDADGSIHAHCFASHEGVGQKHWNEHALHALATGRPTAGPNIDAVRDLPATWAGEQYRRFQLATHLGEDGVKDAIVGGAERLWRRSRAEFELSEWKKLASWIEAQHPSVDVLDRSDPELGDFISLYDTRQRPYLGLGPLYAYYDERYRDLRIRRSGGPDIPVFTSGTSFPIKDHAHEWRASEGFRITVEHKVKTSRGKEKQKTLTIKPVLQEDQRYLSHWNKVRAGHPGALAALGLPLVENHVFPVAFVESSWSIDVASCCLRQTVLPRLREGDPLFDVVGFFERLYDDGRLPLASRDDVHRFIMAITSPFLRELAPGLLGVYWFTGPPGAGKDFLAEIPAMIWREALGYQQVKASFDISATDDLEQKRTFYAAYPAIYGRAKEAGKRTKFIELIIRLAGTDRVPARGMHKDEVEVLSTFTFLADSAEDLPERKEISRRTVVINVAEMDDGLSKGEVLAEIKQHAPDIIRGLQGSVESRSREWYLDQTGTNSRPIIPVALSKLFNTSLPSVEGRRLDDIFEAMQRYIEEDLGGDEGKRELAQAATQKVSKAAKICPSFPYSHFADVMGQQVGYRALLREFGTLRQFQMALERETAYPKVKQDKLPYLRVEIHGRPYALRLVKSNRNFILLPELDYCRKVGIQPIGPPATGAPAETSTSSDQGGGPGPIGGQRKGHEGALCFSEEDITVSARRKVKT